MAGATRQSATSWRLALSCGIANLNSTNERERERERERSLNNAKWIANASLLCVLHQDRRTNGRDGLLRNKLL
ncbi:MAG: hypothetical protein N7Q72_04335, partial [Spiroplasma sp. Tabriz.8]|nr:hypothetical protein [Spiroplasma sp. Tabriz.8]